MDDHGALIGVIDDLTIILQIVLKHSNESGDFAEKVRMMLFEQ
jgi:hypothetical protein